MFNMFKKILTLTVLISFSAVSIIGCGRKVEEPSLTTWQAGAANYNAATSDFIGEMEIWLTGVHTMCAYATKNFAVNLQVTSEVQSITTQEIKTIAASFDATLAEMLPHAAKALLLADEMISAAAAVTTESIATASATSIFIKQDRGDDRPYRQQVKAQFLIILGAIVIGTAITGYFAYKDTVKAIETRAAPAAAIIQQASGNELRQINDSLGLDPNAGKESALAKFNSLGTSQKISQFKSIEEIHILSGDASQAGKIKTSVANAAVQLGQTAVKTTVSGLTAVTGGQGAQQIAEKVTGSVIVSQGVDLALSAAELQPLDILGNKLSVQVTSKTKNNKTIDKPSADMTKQSAKDKLQKLADGKLNDVNASDAKPAGDTVGKDIATTYANELGTVTNADGSQTVSTAAEVHLHNVTNPKSGEKISFTSLGELSALVDMIVGIISKFPEIITNVDMSAHPDVGIENKNIAETTVGDIQPPSSSKYDLVVTLSPNNPAPKQSVNVYAQVYPAASGVSISFSVVGTDGYTNSATYTTGASGRTQAFYIPGGAKGVTDTVTVSIPSQGTTKTYTYVF